MPGLTTVDGIALAAILGSVVYAFARKALLSLTLGVAIILVFALEQVPGGGVFYDLGLVYVSGQFPAPYAWVTYQFVHLGLSHLLFNLLALLLISPVFEDRIGSARFAVLYFVGGIVGAIGFVLLNARSDLVLIGASGSISAIFGAYGRLYPRDRVALLLPIPGVPSLPVIDVVLGFLVLEAALSYLGAFVGLAGIAWEAHVVSMAFGFVAAPLVMRIPAGPKHRQRLAPIAGWRALATTPETQRILEEAEAADLPEVRDAWLEKLVQAAKCPKCGGPLRRRLGVVSSPCGWRARVR